MVEIMEFLSKHSSTEFLLGLAIGAAVGYTFAERTVIKVLRGRIKTLESKVDRHEQITNKLLEKTLTRVS